MIPDSSSPRSDVDHDEQQFLADAGLPAAEAAPWRGCPPLPLLLAADEAALPPDEQHAVAGHLAGCAFCRSLVEDVKEAGLGAPTAEESDRILARVRSQSAAAERPFATAWRQWFRGPAVLAAAASLVLALGLGWYARSLQQRADGLEQALAPLRGAAAQEQRRVAVLEGQLAALQAQLQQPDGQPNVPVVDLEPVSARRADGGSRTFRIAGAARFVTVILQLDAPGSGDDLTAEIRNDRGGVLWSIDGLRAADPGVVTLLVPRTGVPDGDSVITLVRSREGRRVIVAEYRVRFDRV